MRHLLQRFFNGVNVYCRLCDLGFSMSRAKRWGLVVSKWVHPILYGKRS